MMEIRDSSSYAYRKSYQSSFFSASCGFGLGPSVNSPAFLNDSMTAFLKSSQLCPSVLIINTDCLEACDGVSLFFDNVSSFGGKF